MLLTIRGRRRSRRAATGLNAEEQWSRMMKNAQLTIDESNRRLKALLLRQLPEQGALETEIKGLTISRKDEADKLENCFYRPTVGIVVQGSKRSTIGSEQFTYGEKHCMIAGIDIPSLSYITNASAERPFLAISLTLDHYLIAQLAAEIKDVPPVKGAYRGVSVAEVDADVLDAFLRLASLLERPEQIAVLAPMIVREIHYRLLIGPQGAFLRTMGMHGTQNNQIAGAISWLRDNFKDPLQIDALAGRVNMAPSTFHRYFKQVTTLSPLQFQKRLRLYEAQRLMLTANVDAGVAALAVGYESATQFSREYKRLFGEPPRRDINRLQY